MVEDMNSLVQEKPLALTLWTEVSRDAFDALKTLHPQRIHTNDLEEIYSVSAREFASQYEVAAATMRKLQLLYHYADRALPVLVQSVIILCADVAASLIQLRNSTDLNDQERHFLDMAIDLADETITAVQECAPPNVNGLTATLRG